MTSPDDPIVAASAFATALAPAGFELDYSLRSLEIEVDRVLALPLFRRNKKDPTIEQGRHEAALTAYIGETLRRLFDGRWRGCFHRDIAYVNFFTWVEFGSYRFYPWAYVHAQLSEGWTTVGTFQDMLAFILGNICRALHRGIDQRSVVASAWAVQ